MVSVDTKVSAALGIRGGVPAVPSGQGSAVRSLTRSVLSQVNRRRTELTRVREANAVRLDDRLNRTLPVKCIYSGRQRAVTHLHEDCHPEFIQRGDRNLLDD